MGSGKTYTGRKLAEKMEMPFVDLDEWLEAKEGKSIKSIFEINGEAYFREAERDALREMAQFPAIIVSCGGGAPCFHQNLRWMNQQGITIYLQAPVEVLAYRLAHQQEQRPLLGAMNKETLKQYIYTKLEEREPFYMESSVIYKQHSETEQVAETLLLYFQDIIGH